MRPEKRERDVEEHGARKASPLGSEDMCCCSFSLTVCCLQANGSTNLISRVRKIWVREDREAARLKVSFVQIFGKRIKNLVLMPTKG